MTPIERQYVREKLDEKHKTIRRAAITAIIVNGVVNIIMLLVFAFAAYLFVSLITNK